MHAGGDTREGGVSSSSSYSCHSNSPQVHMRRVRSDSPTPCHVTSATSACLLVFLPVCLCLSVCLSVCPSVCICLSVCVCQCLCSSGNLVFYLSFLCLPMSLSSPRSCLHAPCLPPPASSPYPASRTFFSVHGASAPLICLDVV